MVTVVDPHPPLPRCADSILTFCESWAGDVWDHLSPDLGWSREPFWGEVQPRGSIRPPAPPFLELKRRLSPIEGGGGLARGNGVSLFAFGGAYWPLALAHSDPLWAEPLDELSFLNTIEGKEGRYHGPLTQSQSHSIAHGRRSKTWDPGTPLAFLDERPWSGYTRRLPSDAPLGSWRSQCS